MMDMVFSALLLFSTSLALTSKMRSLTWVQVTMWIVLFVEAVMFVWLTFVQPGGTDQPTWSEIALFVLAGVNVAIWTAIVITSATSRSVDDA